GRSQRPLLPRQRHLGGDRVRLGCGRRPAPAVSAADAGPGEGDAELRQAVFLQLEAGGVWGARHEQAPQRVGAVGCCFAAVQRFRDGHRPARAVAWHRPRLDQRCRAPRRAGHLRQAVRIGRDGGARGSRFELVGWDVERLDLGGQLLEWLELEWFELVGKLVERVLVVGKLVERQLVERLVLVREFVEWLELEWLELERQQLVGWVMARSELGLTPSGRGRWWPGLLPRAQRGVRRRARSASPCVRMFARRA